MIGFKDNDCGYGGDKLLKKTIEIEILHKIIFSKSSPLYEKLYNDGLINPPFSSEYTHQIDYGYSAIEGQSKNPQKVYDEIIKYIDELKQNGLDEEDFIRSKKAIWGKYIRSYNNIEDFAHQFLSDSFVDIDYFKYYDIYKTVIFEDVKKRFLEHFDKNYSAISIVNPV